MLDASVVDKNVHPAAPHLRRCGHHVLNLITVCQVGTVETNFDAKLFGHGGNHIIDLSLIAKAIQHYVRALFRQHTGNTQTDATGGTSYQCNLSGERSRN